MTNLYNHSFREKDNCGFGFIANIEDKPGHWVVQQAIDSLSRLSHRGVIADDGLSGDGCGILLRMPHSFTQKIAEQENFILAKQYAVGMFFFPKTNVAASIKEDIENIIERQGFHVAGWRDVPINPSVCGKQALETLPDFAQIFINIHQPINHNELYRRLFMIRCILSENWQDEPEFYTCSLSQDTLIYKGLVTPENLPVFYPDLADPDMQSSLAIFHQRFSTNTLPKWKLAQPFRILAHNGEINTIQANRSWAKTRLPKILGERMPEISYCKNVINQTGSDSSSLDNMLDLLIAGGMDIKRAIRLLIPPAWQNVEHFDPDLRAFYEYNSMHLEPWDGPAGIVLTDGHYAGCTSDRNGLRPTRYIVTKDNHIIIASEAGTCDIDERNIVEKGRLRAGQLMMVDLKEGKILYPKDIDNEVKNRAPYRKWLHDNAKYLSSTFLQEYPSANPMSAKQRITYEKLFQITLEEQLNMLTPMGEKGLEPVASMGDDTPIASLSNKIRPLYDYFRQDFAQVTNPPIDPLREAIVMSLQVCLGSENALFRETQSQAARLLLDSPILTEGQFLTLTQGDDDRYLTEFLDLNVSNDTPLANAIDTLCEASEKAAMEGKTALVLSDHNIGQDRYPIHALLAVGAIHNYLIQKELRHKVNIIVKTATARNSHHMACLLAYGATLIYPYLAYETLTAFVKNGQIDEVNLIQIGKNYRGALDKGIYKIMSKMGISTLPSYRGSQLFEVLGLDQTITDKCFSASLSRIQGADWDILEAEAKSLVQTAYNLLEKHDVGGFGKLMASGEYHCYNPDVIISMQKAAKTGDYEYYKQFADHVNNRPVATLRDLMSINSDRQPISTDAVEPISDIVKRFDSAAMSLGALSPEAHEVLAMAMNRLGARSNSGEGGEDPARFGTDKVSKIKQIASGRFGVTPHYLVNAEMLQIKIAQGAKPGEGGQLPGNKVNKLIAWLRYSKPGITLISPPPHHDIYSIEDLAQLIFDLKQINPNALVSVKLVSSAGVGTIAAGVAKAYADFITISGHDGGTGASPYTSIYHAGSPWELGLSETHQSLLENDLRHKVTLQTDGGLKTGLDVIKAALLGAESFGFGTAPMVTIGCKYLRICHLNNCATGVATQHDILRQQHFHGDVEKVTNYFRFVATEIREILASMGYHCLDEIIGKSALLSQKQGETKKQQNLDLSKVIDLTHSGKYTPQKTLNTPYDTAELNQRALKDASTAIEQKQDIHLAYDIRNTDRSFGATLSGYIAQKWGRDGMQDASVKINLMGTAGQSFGVWNAEGLELRLTGEANDYVGKGMNGGKIIIHPHENVLFDPSSAPIIGNTCLYGATGGTLFAAGHAGERFAVRNSGALAIVEGVGDHGCEYMTGGVVVCLGKTGINFGAGMTGGFAFTFDEDDRFMEYYNHELVGISRISTLQMREYTVLLQQLLEQYQDETQSKKAAYILENYSILKSKFWLVQPKAEDINNLYVRLNQAL